MKKWNILMVSVMSALVVLTGYSVQAAEGKILIENRHKFTEAQVQIIEAVEKTFQAEIKAANLPITVNLVRAQSRVANSTDFQKTYINIDLSKNLTSPHLFAAVLCHELGHAFGGSVRSLHAKLYETYTPLYTDVEGQADYFAATKCIPRIAAVLPEVKIHASCEKAEDPQRCSQVAQAGTEVVRYMAKDESMTIDTRSFHGTKATFNKNPPNHCRMMTWKAGALCGADPYVNFSHENADTGACLDWQGKRPVCWYVRGSSVRDDYDVEMPVGLN